MSVRRTPPGATLLAALIALLAVASALFLLPGGAIEVRAGLSDRAGGTDTEEPATSVDLAREVAPTGRTEVADPGAAREEPFVVAKVDGPSADVPRTVVHGTLTRHAGVPLIGREITVVQAGQVVATATTAEDGSYRTRPLPPAWYRVVYSSGRVRERAEASVTLDGSEAERRVDLVYESDTQDVVVVLRTSDGRSTVEVLEEEGLGHVVGTLERCFVVREGGANGEHVPYRFERASRGLPARGYSARAATDVAPFGTLCLQDWGERSVAIEVGDAVIDAKVVREADDSVELTVDPEDVRGRSARVVGRWFDALTGEPVAVEVTIVRGRFDTPSTSGQFVVPKDAIREFADASGRFESRELPIGTWSVLAAAEGYADVVRTVELGPGGADLGSIALEAPVSLSGRVTAITAFPIDVTCFGVDRPVVLTRRAAADGSFEFGRLAPGVYRVAAAVEFDDLERSIVTSDGGVVVVSDEIVMVDEGTKELARSLHARPRCVTLGRGGVSGLELVLETFHPVTVRFEPDPTNARTISATDTSGLVFVPARVATIRLPEGTVVLALEAAGGTVATRTIAVVAGANEVSFGL
ncbi:MAG: carboxypeptidase-like regulatory domain-containing protein [Planctomycetota bacterium]